MLKSIVNSPIRSGNQTILNGNIVIGTAGNGVDFSADPSAAGATSQLLDDYEEGTWTPIDSTASPLTLTANGFYTKVGNLVTIEAFILFPSNAKAVNAVIGGFPYAIGNGTNQYSSSVCHTNSNITMSVLASGGAGAVGDIRSLANNGITYLSLSGYFIIFTLSYTV